MAKQEQSTGPGGDNLSSISRQFRQTAGLPERTSDAPVTNDADASELRIAREPEGGYGGQGETETETAAAEAVAPGELTGGETATEVARVTGEDTPDVKPAGENDTEAAEEKAPAKKAAAKKTADKGKGR